MNMNPYDLMNNLNNIQQKAKEIQEKLKNISCTGYSGLDMIQVTMTGDFKVTEVKIDPKVLETGTPDMLEVLISFAVNSAVDKIKEKIKEESQQSYGINIPGLNL